MPAAPPAHDCQQPAQPTRPTQSAQPTQPVRYSRVIVANTHAPHAARSFTRRVFGDEATDLLMVVDELVANAVTHARGPVIAVSFQRIPDGVLTEVADADPRPPAPRQASDEDDSGRGLAIVAALSARWGWRPEGRGKAVFAVVPEQQ